MGTILIKNGTIIDGTGAPAFEGHLVMEGDKISAVIKGNESLPEAEQTIDATGCAISPGFIDMHSHMDWVMPLDDHPKLLKPFIEQGITSIVAGNCGYSPAPINEVSMKLMKDNLITMLTDEAIDYSWESMGEFLDTVDETEPAINMAQLAGHASARIAAAGSSRKPLTPEQLKDSLELIRRSLDEGACGVSFGLGYDPGMYSPLSELKAFCKVAKDADKPATVHLKALSLLSPTYPLTYLKPHNLRALQEMLDLARETGVRLQISHFIFVGRRSWGTAPRAIEMVEDARRDGVDVMVDAFSYTCGNTTVNAVLPYWFLAMAGEGYRSRWARMKLRAELELGFRLVGFMYKDFQVMDAGIAGMEDINGLTIDQVAKKWKMGPFDTMLRLCELSGGKTMMLFHTYSGEAGNEKALESVLAYDQTLIETDALFKSTGYPNPASMGTYPRVLGKYVRDMKLMELEDAVRRMTGASAERFGIKDRGVLAAHKAADIVVFDPESIADTPPVDSKPAGRPRGIKYVFINGEKVVEDGKYITGVRPGKVLKN